MTKKICIYILCISLSHSLLPAKKITDVSTQNPHYKAIKKSVDMHYLSLFDNHQFQGNRPLSRKEAAIMINKLLIHVYTINTLL